MRGGRFFCHVYLSHINITMPKGGEAAARLFYAGQLGLRELPKPESLRAREGLWFDAGGLHLQLSVCKERSVADRQGHVGLGCGDVENLKARLKAAGVRIEEGAPVPWKRFFVHDPFGNRSEIHQPRGMRR